MYCVLLLWLAEYLRVAVSHKTADTEWQRRFKHLTKGSGGTHTEADVKEVFTLLRSMLTIDPACRAEAEDVLRHPWFTRDRDGGTSS